jgi:LytTr DNA-binding domain
MPHDPRSLLDRYLPVRRWFEVGFWVVNLFVHAAINSVVTILDIERVGLDVASWQPVVWEWTSAVTMLMLVPAVVAFEDRFPLYFGQFRRHLPWHVLATVAFSVLHVAGMVGLRKLAYGWQGSYYDFGDWPREFGYEYLKDWQSYAGILLIVAAYRLLLLRLQGEARLLDPPDDETPPIEPVDRPDRFLVRKLGKEFLVAANDIEVLQASGNYVNLRVRGRDYPLRTTMAAIEPRLDPARFVRVHRSYMVNLDCVAEIEPLDTGDARLLMRDGAAVPCSRRYRAALRR